MVPCSISREDRELLDTIDISDDVEQMLQDAHDDEFVYVPAQRVYVERCVTCNDVPLWGCALFGCNPTESCFIKCPSCGRYGFTPPAADFVPDHDLAALLLEKMGR
jgi:hypothetical protein